MRSIKQIDRDGNGYVTNTELDDILKLTFPNELTTKRLKPIFKEFASIQNKILIDYKRFRDKLLILINNYEEGQRIRKLKEEEERNQSLRKKRLADKIYKLRETRNFLAS